MRFRHVIGASVLALLATSCSLGDPVDAGSIRLFIDVNDSQLTRGEDTITVTLRAQNVGYDPLQLTGPSDCLLYVEVVDNQGIAVWNSNGQCSGATVTEQLVVGTDKIQSFTWDGTNFAGGFLSEGLYHLRALARLSTGTYLGAQATVALD